MNLDHYFIFFTNQNYLGNPNELTPSFFIIFNENTVLVRVDQSYLIRIFLVNQHVSINKTHFLQFFFGIFWLFLRQ